MEQSRKEGAEPVEAVLAQRMARVEVRYQKTLHG
jgi:hypothetical protein